MELPDKIAAVDRMQAYITAHAGEPITLDALAEAAGYRKYHAVRIFIELLHRIKEAMTLLKIILGGNRYAGQE